MKNPIITTILLITWAGVFSQQLESLSIFQENAIIKPDENKVSMNSANTSDFEEILTSWCESNHIPGMSVCILKNGDVFWNFNYGFANIEQEKPVTDSTCFILCSVSKLFVQTAIMQLYEQEYFDLDDDINGYLPQSINNPNKPDSAITYFQLMTHTSSIVYGFPTLYQYLVWGEDPTIALGDFMEGSLIPGGPYYHNGYLWGNYYPGAQWDYSNMGNCLLGYLIECMSGQELDDYLQENIFSPLGMNNASYFLSNMDTSYLAVPYNYSAGSYVSYLQPGAPFYPSAFLKMSAADLAIFLGMYMKHGTYNGTMILDSETIELITTPNEGTLYSTPWGQMCLTWGYLEDQDMTYWGGGWDPIASSGIGYDKDDQWGMLFLVNTRLDNTQHFELQDMLVDFAKHYEPFSVEHITVTDTDGNQVIEANDSLSLGFKIRNKINFPGMIENVTATISVSSPFINLISDSVVSLGTFNYLDEIQIPDDQFVFEVNGNIEPGNIEFQMNISWDEGNEYMIAFNLFAGNAAVLLVRDEESVNSTQDWYLQSLDSLGYLTNYYDVGIRDDLTTGFINGFPAVIWFTGIDDENTLSEYDQSLLAGYLDNGGNLFLSGQNISDELVETDFLQNYLFTEHLEDTWSGMETIMGIENDPIGNGLVFQVNQGDGLANQYSMSVVEPLEGSYKVFGYQDTLDGAAIRYDNDIYKTVFFAFGFEAIKDYENRHEVLFRILNDYFGVIVEAEEHLMVNTVDGDFKVFPNPWSTFTTFSYTLNENSPVKLDIYNINGQLIKTVSNNWQQKGKHEVFFEGAEFLPGIYFCVLKTTQTTLTKKNN